MTSLVSMTSTSHLYESRRFISWYSDVEAFENTSMTYIPFGERRSYFQWDDRRVAASVAWVRGRNAKLAGNNVQLRLSELPSSTKMICARGTQEGSSRQALVIQISKTKNMQVHIVKSFTTIFVNRDTRDLHERLSSKAVCPWSGTVTSSSSRTGSKSLNRNVYDEYVDIEREFEAKDDMK